MIYKDRYGRRRQLSEVQVTYLEAAENRQFDYGWQGLKSTETVRLLDERGLIRLAARYPSDVRWRVQHGLTDLGRDVLARWRHNRTNGPVLQR